MAASPSATYKECGANVLAAILAGASVKEAAEGCGCSSRTVHRWIKDGRDRPDGAYGKFAQAVDRVREERELPDEMPVDAGELKTLLSQKVRAGNVQAMRLYADRFLPRDDGPHQYPGQVGMDPFDQLEAEDGLARLAAETEGRGAK